MARNCLPCSIHILISRSAAPPPLGIRPSQNQVSVFVDADRIGALKSDPDDAGVASGGDFEIVFELALIAVVDKVNPRIQVSISDPFISRNVLAPFAG